jgi:hypothetical protein
LDFRIYPNPAENMFNLDLSKVSGTVELRMFDMSQKIVYSETTSGGNTAQIEVKNFESGKYFVEISAQGQRYLVPLMIR